MARVSFAGVRRVVVVVLWLLLFLMIGIGVSVLAGTALRALAGGRWWIARDGIAQSIGFGAATLMVGRWLDHYEWRAMGWSAPRRLPRRFGLGLALGAVMAGLAVLLTLLDGARVSLTPRAGSYLAVAGTLGLGLLAAALSEELIFRGYPLRRLADTIGPAAATGVLAVGFSLGHLGNPNVGALGAMNIALAAMWLSVAFFTGGMGLAWGLHAGWNMTLTLAFDAPLSGMRLDIPGVDYALGRHSWIGGGAFGPEGGVAGTLALLAGTAVLLGRRLSRPRHWLLRREPRT